MTSTPQRFDTPPLRAEPLPAFHSRGGWGVELHRKPRERRASVVVEPAAGTHRAERAFDLPNVDARAVAETVAFALANDRAGSDAAAQPVQTYGERIACRILVEFRPQQRGKMCARHRFAARGECEEELGFATGETNLAPDRTHRSAGKVHVDRRGGLAPRAREAVDERGEESAGCVVPRDRFDGVVQRHRLAARRGRSRAGDRFDECGGVAEREDELGQTFDER